MTLDPVDAMPPQPAPATLDAVDAMFRSLVDDGTAPGIAYGVVDRTGLVHAGGYGVACENGPRPDATTAFRIASMTKSFTAASVLLLAERGALSLADPVRRSALAARANQVVAGYDWPVLARRVLEVYATAIEATPPLVSDPE